VALGGVVVPAINETGDRGVQISENLVLATPIDHSADIADFINHSCDPSSGFQGQLFLVARRPLVAGEEITFDYAMCLHPVDGLDPYQMSCRCGAPLCRGVITEDDWRDPALQAQYTGYFQLYLQEKIDRLGR
jgi:hypothetical protein